jgi:purine-binding chemotaxis protein CheW
MAADDSRLIQHCTFRTNGRLFAAPILDVKEICGPERLTPVPHTGAAVSGLVNIRGQFKLIVDLRHLMGYEQSESAGHRHFILFKERVGADFCLAVEDIGNIEQIDPDTIVDRRKDEGAAPSEGDRRQARAQMVAGVATLDNEVAIVLKPERILEGLPLLAMGNLI